MHKGIITPIKGEDDRINSVEDQIGCPTYNQFNVQWDTKCFEGAIEIK